MLKYLFLLLFLSIGIISCGPKICNEVWKQNPYSNECIYIESNYNNYALHLPMQYPETTCHFQYYPDYEDGYYYCNDINNKIWNYFKTPEECISNGGHIS